MGSFYWLDYIDSYYNNRALPLAHYGSVDSGSFSVGSFNLGSFNLGSFSFGSFNIGSFDIFGSFNIGSFDIFGSFELGSFITERMNTFPTHEFEPLNLFGYGIDLI